MVISVTVDTSEVQAALNQFTASGLSNVYSSTLDKLEALAIQGAQKIVPVRTGRLKRSIKRQQKGRDFVVVGSTLDYAKPVETGTFRMRARPYMKPQIQAVQSEGVRILQQELRKIIG